MDHKDNFFKTVSQVASTVHQLDNNTSKIQELLNQIEQQTLQFINNDGASIRRGELLRKVEEALTEARMQISFPFLINHSNIMVLGASSQDCFRILGQALDNNPPPAVALGNFNLPTMLYHDTSARPPMVYNRMGNAIALPPEELSNFLKLGQSKAVAAKRASHQGFPVAQARHIARLCTMPMWFKPEYQNLCFIFVNRQSIKDHELLPELLNMCHGVITPADCLADKDTADLLYARPLELLVLPAADGNAPSCNSGKRSDETISCKQLTVEQLIPELGKYNRTCFNLTLGRQIQSICCEITNFTQKELQQCTQNITQLNAFTVEAHESRNGVRGILSQENERRNLLKSRIERSDRLQRLVFEQLDLVNGLLMQQGLNLDPNAQCWSAGSIAIWRELFLQSVASDDQTLAQKSLSLRELCADPLVPIEEYSLKTNRMSVEDFESRCPDINNITLKHLFIALVQERFCDLGGMERKQEMAVTIPDAQRTGYEHYLVGSYIYKREGVTTLDSGAVKAWERAITSGNTFAVPKLIQIYLEAANNDSTAQKAMSRLRNLADTMNPEAALAYGELMLKNKKFGLARTYIRNAACQQYEPALKSYTNLVWDDVKRIAKFDDEQKKINAERALSLNQRIFQQTQNPEYASRIGILLYRMDKKSDAFNFLQIAADNGIKQAAYLLGRIFFYGDGVARDNNKARYYLNMSDSESARKLLQKLNSIEEKRQQRSSHSYSSSSNYSSSSSYSSYSSGGIFGAIKDFFSDLF